MYNNSYFPVTEADQVIWLSHYALRLPLMGPICGISPEEISNTLEDISCHIWLLQTWYPATQRDAKKSTSFKRQIIDGDSSDIEPYPIPSVFTDIPKIVAPGIKKRLLNQVARIKTNLNYTETIGHDLGIIAIASKVEHPIPEFTASVEQGSNGNRVRIDFNKYGHEGILIESRTNNGDWVFLAIDTVKPYYDERPLATGNSYETREYRARWWDKSIAHGEWSSVGRVVLEP
jgi:hypothetical protein